MMMAGRRFVLTAAFTVLLPVILCLMAGHGPTDAAPIRDDFQRNATHTNLASDLQNNETVPAKKFAGPGTTKAASAGVGGERDWIDKSLDFLTGYDEKVPNESGYIFGWKVGEGGHYSEAVRVAFIVVLAVLVSLAKILIFECCSWCCSICRIC